MVFWRIYVDGVEVKAGESQPEFHETEGKGKRRFVLRYYSIFNTEQCDLPATITGGHATRHPKRFNRDSIKDLAPFGSPVYSLEELLAELSTAYLCGIAGIESRTIDNSAAYRDSYDNRELAITSVINRST